MLCNPEQFSEDVRKIGKFLTYSKKNWLKKN